MADDRLTWEEMVKKYPDRWVVVKNAEMSGPDILSGILVDALSDDEIMEYRFNNKRHDLEFCRTTEGDFDGIIDSDISISVN